MPCLELKVDLQRPPEPASRLRSLMERPGAAVLRRNYVADAPGHEDAALLHSRLRVTAVLAVDLTDPPQEADPAAETHEESEPAQPELPIQEAHEPLENGFAKGLEIRIADGARAVCVHADADEIAGALVMFDAYLRLARYQPAYQRLDQRIVGLCYNFREGLSVGIEGNPRDTSLGADTSLDAVAAIPELEDARRSRMAVRFSNAGISFLHDLLRSASAWLDENSYPSILGAK